MPIHVRPKQAVLRCLHERPGPISAEQIAELTCYSVPHIWRVLIALRDEQLLESTRPKGSHALAYRVNEPMAIERGLLP